MTKKECHGCTYLGKPKGAKRWWCMVPYSKCPLKAVDGCLWWHHYGTDKEARKHKENYQNNRLL